MVGMFAFALKKKKETEIAYIVIEWADEIGEHETIFELGSLMMANRSRSTILLALNEVKKKDKKAKNTN